MALDIQGVTPLLEVFDMPASIAFYRDVVRTSQAGDHFSWAYLKLNDAELMLNSAYEDGERPAAPDLSRLPGHADTELFLGCPDVDAAYAHFRARGIDVQKPVIRDYGMKQLWLSDPDGFKLCFQWPMATR